MNIALVTIGNELLFGFTVNTNATWIGQKVLEAGGNVVWHQTIGDTEEEIQNALNIIPNNIDAVIITGGLGPTHDDVTAKALYNYVDDKPIFDEEYWNNLKQRMSARNIKIPEINKNQAMRPEIGQIIDNPIGSARGLHFSVNGQEYFALPGVPREMKSMMNSTILPWIRKQSKSGLLIKTIHTTGIMESGLAERLGDVISQVPDNIKIAFLPQFIGVDIRLAGSNIGNMDTLQKSIKSKVQKYIYGYDNESLEEVVGKLLYNRQIKLSTAESCTGGLLGHRLTNIPGSSDYFAGGIVSYSNEVKEKTLGVKHETLEIYGAVSAETAIEMAENVRLTLESDIGVSITGIAGPTGGTKEKPVGLTFIALADGKSTSVKEFRFLKERELNKKASSQAALNIVRLYLLNE